MTFSGTLSTSNVADDALPTSVIIDVIPTTECALIIESAEFLSPDDVGRPLIRPIDVPPNVDGNYISILQNAPDPGGQFSPRFRLKYSPQDAEITELTLNIITNDVVAENAINLLDTADVEEGTIEIDQFTLPQYDDPILNQISTDSTSLSFNVRIAGTIDGEDVETSTQIVNVEFEGNVNFTPLFLAEEEITSIDRRYGVGNNERGDDSWARPLMIEYLESVPYRFNDVSSQHVTQFASGRNILDHARHSDGLSADFRYEDPDGVTEEGFGRDIGAGFPLLNLIYAAEAELENGTGTANQEELSDFILLNRQIIEQEAEVAEAIFIGINNFWRAMVAGQYPNGEQIIEFPIPEDEQGVPQPAPIGRWTARPNIVGPASNHTDHWHITLNPNADFGNGGLEE